jgi:uncharacterized protein (DUF1330 family)
MHYLTVEEDDLQGLLASYPTDQPVVMLNLLRFRAKADYPPGHMAEACSGAQAFARYGQGVTPLLTSHGGVQLWQGRFNAMLIGPQDKHWQLITLVKYPTAQAFVDMVSSPDYQAIAVHRGAAVLDSRLMALTEL